MSSGGSKGGGSENYTIGFKYFMSLHMGICLGRVDEMVEIKVGDLRAWPLPEGTSKIKFIAEGPDPNSPRIHRVDGSMGSAANAGERNTLTSGTSSGYIGAEELFGGDSREGGIKGTMKVSMGSGTDTRPWFADVGMTGIIPGMRGVLSVLFDGMICAMNPYPKKWTYRVRRTVSGWDGATWEPNLATIWLNGDRIKAMNPVHIILECITNTSWGRGLPIDSLNLTMFKAAAQTAFNEEMGLCLKWTRQTPLDDFISVVLDHLGASLFVDRRSGKIGIQLFRFDYVPEDVPLYDYDSGLLSVDENETATGEDTVNEIVVKWYDPSENAERQSRVQNLASIQTLNGAIRSNTKSYPGLSTGILAMRVAQRDLKVGSTALKRYTLKLDRRASYLHTGALIRIHAPELGILNAILRVGKLTESAGHDGTITAECILDVFGLPFAAFAVPQESIKVHSDRSPFVPEYRKIREATWGDVVRNIDRANLALLTDDTGFVNTLATKPSSMSLGYKLTTAPAGEELGNITGTGTFNPSFQLDGELGWKDQTLFFRNGMELGLVRDDMVLQLNDEILNIWNIQTSDGKNGTATIRRGISDSIPRSHFSGSVGFMHDVGTGGRDGREYVRGETVNTKLLTFTSSATMPLNQSPTDTILIRARQARPFPPAYVKVNNTLYLDITAPVSKSSDVILAWRHRNRLAIMDRPLSFDKPSTTTEPDTQYRIQVSKVEGSDIKRTVYVPSSDTTFHYTPAMAIEDDINAKLHFTLTTIRGPIPDNITSYHKHQIPLDVSS